MGPRRLPPIVVAVLEGGILAVKIIVEIRFLTTRRRMIGQRMIAWSGMARMLPITSHASLFSRAKTEGDPSNYKRRRENGRETKGKSETEIEIRREIKQGFVSLLSQNPSPVSASIHRRCRAFPAGSGDLRWAPVPGSTDSSSEGSDFGGDLLVSISPPFLGPVSVPRF